MNEEEIEKIVKDSLSEERFYHSKCVMKRCIELAKIYGVDGEKAKLIGLVHDIAKEMPENEKLRYAQENNLIIDEIEKNNIDLLHAKIGADIGRKRFEFTDDMVKAIENHTTGKENMDILSKILFVADVTGEDRNYENKDFILNLSEKSLNRAALEILDFTIKNVVERGKLLHLDTVKARNYLIEEIKKNNK